VTISPPTKEFTQACKDAEFKEIEGYEGHYAVSSCGIVISLARVVQRVNGRPLNKRSRVLKQVTSPNGYRMVTFSKDDVRKTFTVHSLVAQAWIGRRETGMQVCHNDGDKMNNHVSNLRYGTGVENSQDRHKHGTAFKGENHPKSKLSERQILKIKSRLKEGHKQRDVATEFRVSKSLIWAINTGRAWAHVE
jgi:hypothetical protein